jgi:hypothetical protein
MCRKQKSHLEYIPDGLDVEFKQTEIAILKIAIKLNLYYI